jgi:hypothetical protein
MKLKISILLCLAFLSGCAKRYRFTAKVCDNRLYVEVFQVNPFGVDADYLTDSISFRKYIGDSDEEHETYSYTCIGDSVHVLKSVRGNRWAKMDTTSDGTATVISNEDTLENYNLNLSDLKKLNNYK